MTREGRLSEQSATEAVDHNGMVHKVVATHPQAVADLVANLSWTVLDEHEMLEYLQRCVNLAVRLIQGADHASVTTAVRGNPFTAVCTDQITLLVDAHQYEAGDGPCLHAMSTGELVGVDVSTSAARWPQFTTDAVSIGVRSFLAAPIGEPDDRIGALNLYSTRTDGFDGDDADLLTMIVDYTARTITDYTRLSGARDLAEQLREAMATRAPIEQAKGILMAAHHITAEQAFQVLRKQSQDTNTKLNTLAAEFVATHST